jgi:hypothetical protein
MWHSQGRTMIRAKPKHVFSWGFDLDLGAGSQVGFDMSWFREGGRFTWDGTEFHLSRERAWSGDFLLTAYGQVLAHATKDSVFLRRFTVRVEDRELVLHAASSFSRRFELIEGDSVVGGVAPDGFFTRACTAEFPNDLSVPVQVFLFWLVILMWRRQDNATAAS